MDLARYRKFVVAAVGFAAVLATALGVTVGVDLSDKAIAFVDAFFALLTAVGVVQVTNAP